MSKICAFILIALSISTGKAQRELEYCQNGSSIYFDTLYEPAILNLPIGKTLLDSLEFSIHGGYQNTLVYLDIGVQGSGCEIKRETDSLWAISVYAYFNFISTSDTATEIEILHLNLTKKEVGYSCSTDLRFRPDAGNMLTLDLHSLFRSCAADSAYHLSAFEIGNDEWNDLSLLVNGLFIMSLHGDQLALKEFDQILKLFPAVGMHELHHYYMTARAVLCF